MFDMPVKGERSMSRGKVILRRRLRFRDLSLILSACLSLILVLTFGTETAAKIENQHIGAKASVSQVKLPLYFIENRGQLGDKVKFYEKGNGHATFFTDEGVYLSLHRSQKPGHGIRNIAPETQSSAVVRLVPLNANKSAEIVAEDMLKGKVNYLVGNDPRKWMTNLPAFKALVYKEIYKGIDLKFYGNNRQLEYDIIVKPGADPSAIKLSYEGVEGLSVTKDGDLEIALKEGVLTQKRPAIYQVVNGKRIIIEGKFKVHNDKENDDGGPSLLTSLFQSAGLSPSLEKRGEGRFHRNSKLVTEGVRSDIAPQSGSANPKFVYSFEIASYDASNTLIIDPVINFSTYLGGTGDDRGYGVAVDGSGNVYISGYTYSDDFPTTPGAYDTARGSFSDVFVTKTDSQGSELIYSTYIGGSGGEEGNCIAVDAAGNAYVAGYTYSNNFPTTPGAFQTSLPGSYDGFIVKLNSTGSELLYSTYLGGTYTDIIGTIAQFGYGPGNCIRIDSEGNAYVAGYINSNN